MIIALTGHRPERLGLPKDVSLPQWENIIRWIKTELMRAGLGLTEGEELEVFSGMASGADIAIAYAALQLKENFKLKLTLVCPFEGYGHDNPHYNEILKGADSIINLNKKWVKGCDDARDDYMAKHCDIMLAIYDGNKNGGVWSTLNKAWRYGKHIVYCPLDLITDK